MGVEVDANVVVDCGWKQLVGRVVAFDTTAGAGMKVEVESVVAECGFCIGSLLIDSSYEDGMSCLGEDCGICWRKSLTVVAEGGMWCGMQLSVAVLFETEGGIWLF